MSHDVPTNVSLKTAVEHHLSVFGSASGVVLRSCYPGVAMTTYTKAFSTIPKRLVLRDRPHQRTMIDLAYTRSKLIPIDEAAQAMGDAMVASLWSGNGEILIGDSLDWKLQQYGLLPDELPSTAARGFLGRSAIFGHSGSIFLPLYVGAGAKSADQFTKDIERRFLDTWHTVLALPNISSVVVIGHGMVTARRGLEVLKQLAQMIDRGVQARGHNITPRALRQLNWTYGYLKFNELPLSTLNLVFHPTMRTPDGRLRATLGWPPGIAVTPKQDRKWLWRGGTLNT